MSGVEVVNFGCRLNLAEGEAIRQAWSGPDDAIIFNTCAVTAEAERQARQAIRKAARTHPDRRIIVTGCAADVSRAAFAAMPEIAEIIGNTEKRTMPMRPAVTGHDHVRSFVEVQNGCDHDCTFCVTTLARGASRSIPAGAVIDAIKAAVDKGHAEIVLTGVDLTSYGGDLPGKPTLGSLVERILTHVPSLRRIRLSSLDCIEVDDRLFDLFAGEARLMPHVHMSLQSGDDLILKRMKRRHGRADAVALVDRLKRARPDISFGADIIAGFPTEDDAMFENSLRLIDDCDIVFGHIFPFSPRPGTAAARMPQVRSDIARDRAARLRERVAERKASWLASLVGSRQSVLVESGGRGHAPNYAMVRIEGVARGALIDAHITGTDGELLLATPR